MKLAAAMALCALLQEPPGEKVQELVSRLAAEEIEAREEAFRGLIELGEPALPFLKESLKGRTDAEVLSRLKAAVEQIERNAARSRVYRPARPVTLKAQDVPLEEVVGAVCRQAGVDFSVSAEVAARKVSIEAEKEPLLQALDRLCAGLGDVGVSTADGKIQIVREKFVPYRAAYAEGFRARVKRVLTHVVNNFDAPATTVVLYLSFDTQPDLKARSAVFAEMARGQDERGRELSFKPSSMGRQGGSSMGGGRGHVIVDDVMIPFDSEVRVEHACFLKDAPGALKKLDSLKVKAKYRFAAGTRQATCKLKRREEDGRLEGLPVRVIYMGSHLQLEHAGGRGNRLEDLIDLDTLVVAGKDGKETRCTPLHVSMGYYLFQCRMDASSEAELRVTAYDDVFEKEVEFEFKDVPLRE